MDIIEEDLTFLSRYLGFYNPRSKNPIYTLENLSVRVAEREDCNSRGDIPSLAERTGR